MNILVTGANGQLGNEMRIVSKASKDNYIFSDVMAAENVDTEILDITSVKDVIKIVKEKEINAIINCAAFTNVDAAEKNVKVCDDINSVGAINLAFAMVEVDGLLVHISTDYVFDGNHSLPYKEDDETSPTSVYGKTKLFGEKAIRKLGASHLIFRTSWLYSEFGKNFVKTMMNLMSAKKELKVVFDQIGTPTYAFDLAMAIFDVVENRKYEGKDGIYHFSNEGVCSWYDFAKKIAELTNNTTCDIQPCHSYEFPSDVARPNYSVLDKTKIKNEFNVKVPYWTDSLCKCINNIVK